MFVVRICTKCDAAKELCDFSRLPNGKSLYGHSASCKECVKLRNAKWQANNRDYHNKYNSKWCSNNKGKVAAKAAKRRATKLRATPSWADLAAIKQFYINCPLGYHVDHIIPLKGKNVSGFHVINNLQYLKAVDNLKKGNKYV